MSLAARIFIHPVKTRRISPPRLRNINSPEFNRYLTGFASVLMHGVVVSKNYLYPSRGPLFKPVVVRQNEIGGLSMAKSHITGIEETDPKQGGQKDLPLASAFRRSDLQNTLINMGTESSVDCPLHRTSGLPNDI